MSELMSELGFGNVLRPRVISSMTTSRVGGIANVVSPAGSDALSDLLSNFDMPIFPIGLGSNLLVRDGGIGGLVVKLGSEFGYAKHDLVHTRIIAGAAVPLMYLANYAKVHSLAGLEFFVGIPGTVGGAIAMNAGAYGSDTASVLNSVVAMDGDGKIHTLYPSDIKHKYRGHALSGTWVFIEAEFQVHHDSKNAIDARMKDFLLKRKVSQPVSERTFGSVFKNPTQNNPAWKLIRDSGCSGYKIGGALVSEKHNNFFVNTGNATAEDFENLIEYVQNKVLTSFGVKLELEVKVVGCK